MNLNMDEWDDLVPEQKTPTKVPVRFGVGRYRNGPRRGCILILREVIDRLQMETWRVTIRLGKGPNLDRLAVIPAKDGKFELQEVGLTKGGGTFRLSLPVIETWTEYPCPLSEADWTIDRIFGQQNALFMTLPLPLVSKTHFDKWTAASVQSPIAVGDKGRGQA
ncbi:MAG: hypothetical protein JJ902_23555 [Roseibium sp.]|nr:hypothetical protein [Roseibium sp.]